MYPFRSMVSFRDIEKFKEIAKRDSSNLISKGFYELVKECKEHQGLISISKFETIVDGVIRGTRRK